jgi:ferric-dicitrate binding protein FerR (iron transport regulator)
MNRTEHELELMRLYLEGVASLEETQELESLIVKDASVRQDFLRYTHLDSALAGVRRSQPLMVAPRRSIWLSWRPLAAAAACLAMLCGWWLTRPAQIVEVLAVSGIVKWHTEDGASSVVGEGQYLRAGRFESADEESLLRLRFSDGTQFTLSGAGEARVSEETGKRVVMRGVTLTATVVPQPKGKPLHVLTPTAELEVLGTVFMLDATDDMTRLSVEEGRVRLRRLADGELVEVAADGVLMATHDVSQSLTPLRNQRLPRTWSASFDPVRERIAGRLLAADATGPVRVAAGPKVVSDPMGEGPRLLHWRLYVAAQRGQSFVALAPGAGLEFRMRIARAVPLRVTLRTEGLGISSAVLDSLPPPDAAGWITARVPLAAFTPTPGVNARLNNITLSSLEENAAFEIMELRVTE